jgi:hypothetical protein
MTDPALQILTALSQKRAAQRFNALSVGAILLMPAFPILLLWIAGSILVYAISAHHPNPRVQEYIRFGGYRFYGLVGALLISLTYTNELKRLFGGALEMWAAIWGISILVVVPFGLRDIWRAGKESWQDMQVDQA